MLAGIAVDRDRITEFCLKWQITELALLGSVLRDDFGPDSDADVLVRFADGASWSLLDITAGRPGSRTLCSRTLALGARQACRNLPVRRHFPSG